MTNETSSDATPNSTPTPGIDSVIVPASIVAAPATIETPVKLKKKFVLNLPETLLIILVVISVLHFALKPKSDKPIKVNDKKSITAVVKSDKKEEVTKQKTKSKAEVKAERRHKKNDHTYSGPFSN